MLDATGNMPASLFHFSLFELRSLPYATLAWTKAIFGLDLIYFRLGNLLLHAAVVIALFFFLARLFETVIVEPSLKGLSSQQAAFFAALLFALHPIATYAAGYLVQRSVVMATLFALLTMLVYLHGDTQKKWLWMCIPFYYLSVISKEHAIMLPFVLLALTILMHQDWREKLKQRWAVFGVLALIALFVLLARKGILGSMYEPNATDMLQRFDLELAYPLSVITQTWLFFKYFGLWLFPNPAWMSVDMREPFAQSFSSVYLLATGCFVVWGAVATWLLVKRGKSGMVGFALIFPWLMFMTELASVRIQEPFVLYRSYLWSVGAFCLLPAVFCSFNARISSLILSAIAIAMLPISMERLMTFSNPILLWEDAEKLVKGREDLSGAHRIYYNLGTEWLKIDFADQATAYLKQAIILRPDFGEAYANLGHAYSKKGEWANSVLAYNKATELFQKKGLPPQWKYFYGRAIAFEKMGDIAKAKADYRVTCLLAKKGCEKLPGGDLRIETVK